MRQVVVFQDVGALNGWLRDNSKRTVHEVRAVPMQNEFNYSVMYFVVVFEQNPFELLG